MAYRPALRHSVQQSLETTRLPHMSERSAALVRPVDDHGSERFQLVIYKVPHHDLERSVVARDRPPRSPALSLVAQPQSPC